ncbi:translation factor [Violaceomyces palustris]|uniref:Translation factor n=1 Tax=Violaceomyces palustris TaxID=1673888 RepID=A0ACD0P3R3_9BASI|nr:translation factor [Violaceomyces palustris]
MSSSPNQNLGYPDQTFETEILPCHPSTSISFPSSSSSSTPTPIVSPSSTLASLQIASDHLRQGGLVAFPTETVYGLGASALDPQAVRKIYAAKRRPADNPLIVHVSDRSMLLSLLPPSYSIPPSYEALMQTFWPGALTLLFPVARRTDERQEAPVVPEVVTCGQPTVAVRQPSHPLARALISLTGLPLAAPSANASGRPSPTSARHVMRDLGGELDVDATRETTTTNKVGGGKGKGRLKYILDGGPCQVGLESTVVDGFTQPSEIRVLRPGGVTVEQIVQALGSKGLLKKEEGEGMEGAVTVRVYGKDMKRSQEQEENPTTPGMKYKHYSPSARVAILVPSDLIQADPSIPGGEEVRMPEGIPKDGKHQQRSRNSFENLSSVILSQIQKSNLTIGSERLKVGLMRLDGSSIENLVLSERQPRPASSSSPRKQEENIKSTSLMEEEVEIHPFSLGTKHQPELYARRLFDGLRTLDEGPLLHPDGSDSEIDAQGCDLILVEAMDDSGVGLAVMNRLKKAASDTVILTV